MNFGGAVMLKEREQKILDYMKEEIREKGYPPTAVSYTHLDVYKRQDVSFDDTQHRIDNDGICHTDIQHPVFRGFAGHISHSVPVGFSAAEQNFVSVTIRRVIFFYLRNQAGIRKVDLVTDGRSEHFTIFLSG